MEGNANNVVTLKKKGYNTAVLVLLILFVMIIGGIIYYLLCEDEMVIIKNVGDESINSNFNINTIPKPAFIINTGDEKNLFISLFISPDNCVFTLNVLSDDLPQFTFFLFLLFSPSFEVILK